jgi:DNA mismatch repair protein MutS
MDALPSSDPSAPQPAPPPASLTPMMRQYFAVKAEHPNAIVLFRIGDFFETFYEDAEQAAKLLDLTLTARSKEKDRVPMAGVPHHAVDGYVSRLVELGKTVVLVDQVEDAKLAKGLVKREITDILSPGTFLDPNAPPRLATYLVALDLGAGKRAGFGLAALDLSTGEFRATSGEDGDVLLEELLRLDMREIVISESRRSDERIARIEKELPKTAITAVAEDFFSRRGRDALLHTFGQEELAALEKVHSREALAASGAALAYVEKLQPRKGQFDARAPVFFHLKELRPYVPGDSLVLDREARLHLELFRGSSDGGRRGSLLGAIDEAVTAMGGRTVVRWLAYPLVDRAAIARRQDAIGALVEVPSLLDRIRVELREIGDLERLVGRSVLHRATPRDLALLRSTLERAPLLLRAAEAASRGNGELHDLIPASDTAPKSALLSAIASTDPAADVQDLLARALADEPPIDLDEGDIFRASWDAELDRLSALAKSGKDLIAKMEAEEKGKTGISSLKVRYNRVFGYYIEITKANLRLVPSHYIRKQTTANGERFYTEALQKLETEVLSAEEKRLERTRSLFVALVDEVAKEAKRLLGVARAIAELDALSGFAYLAEKRGWARPEIAEDGAIDIADGRHPVLELFSEELGERFVPNDLSISDERSLMIITGPNMAGKSTIMRQTALIVILAHMGVFVPAKSARIALVDRIFTRVGASDDLSRGRSTFMVEMNETARILRSATSRSLILLDEIGRGTSTFDGLSIAWAVAEYLHDRVGAKTLFATHYHELTEIARDKARAVNHHVAVKEWNEQIVFLRKLQPGSTNRSYGVQVARLAGLPKLVVDRAKEVLASLEAQALSAGDGSWASRRRALDGQLFLFQEPAKKEREKALEDVARALEAIEIDDITPRHALDELARLKTMLEPNQR